MTLAVLSPLPEPMQTEVAVGLPVDVIVPTGDDARSVADAIRRSDLVLYDWRFAAPGFNATAVAEWVLGALFGVARHLHWAAPATESSTTSWPRATS